MSERASFFLALTFGVLAIIGIATVSAIPRPSEPVAVLASPFDRTDPKALEVIAMAEARIISLGGADWIALAAADGPDLVDRLYGAGAFLVLDARFAAACLGVLATVPFLARSHGPSVNSLSQRI
ncbi:MAG: hypothetical protein AAGF58_02375 [Pseudomonadota bacterium]